MANLLCSPVLNQITPASGNPPMSRDQRVLVLAIASGLTVFSTSARSIARPDTPNTSAAMLASLILGSLE
jgi:hypothetical protein